MTVLERADSAPVGSDGPDPAPAAALGEDEERALVGRAGLEPAAFAELYRRYVGRVYAFAYHRSRSREVAEDVTSATFERALHALPRFTWRGGGFEAWLFRIAANELADHYRRERRTSSPRGQVALQRLASAPEPNPVEAAVEATSDPRALLDALGRLRPRYQRALTLRYLAGLSHEQAAVAMGCSKPVMAVLLHRSTLALKRELRRRQQEEQ